MLRAHAPLLARALAPALTPPRFPSPLVFLETLLSVPLPHRPEVLAVFLASLVSAPSLLPRRARDLPPCTPRGTPAIPFPTVIPEGIPGRRWATDFPVGYVGSGEESCPELPPGLGRLGPLGPGQGGKGDGSQTPKSEEGGAEGSDSDLRERRAGRPNLWV